MLEAEKQLSHFGSEWTSCLNVPMTAGDVSSLVVPVISILESILLLLQIYPLVNLQKTMEITIFHGKIRYKWPFSIANCLFTRGYNPWCSLFHVGFMSSVSWTAFMPEIWRIPWLLVNIPLGLHHFWASYLHHCCRNPSWLRKKSPFLFVKSTFFFAELQVFVGQIHIVHDISWVDSLFEILVYEFPSFFPSPPLGARMGLFSSQVEGWGASPRAELLMCKKSDKNIGISPDCLNHGWLNKHHHYLVLT